MLSGLFKEILLRYPYAKENESLTGHELGVLVRNEIPEQLKNGLGTKYIVKGSIGKGAWTSVPWIALMDARITTTTQCGVFVVYLFAADGSALYLTLNQGCADIVNRLGRKKAKEVLSSTAAEIVKNLDIPSELRFSPDFNIGNEFYELGTIACKRYATNEIPADDILFADLHKILSIYEQYCAELKSGGMNSQKDNLNRSIGKENQVKSKQVARHVDIGKIRVYLKNVGLQGATVQELIETLQPDAAVYPTQKALESDDNVILMPGNKYVHVDAFVDLDEAEESMTNILRTHFIQFGGYSNNKLLFGAASHDMSLFLNDNDCADIDSVYALGQYFFGKKSEKKYVFSYPHIFESKPDFPLNLKGVMIHLARLNGGVLVADAAKEYLQKTMLSYGGMGQLLQISFSDTFLMYDSNRYLLSESLKIDPIWKSLIHDRLDNLFRQANVAYVIPRDISNSWLASLPKLPHDLIWTPLLLQEVLKKYNDIGFSPITAGLEQSMDTIAAAFVPNDSPLQSFPDIVTLFMQERHDLPVRMSSDELRLELREAGMIAGDELIYALPKALNDYRFSWTDNNKTVYVRGN